MEKKLDAFKRKYPSFSLCGLICCLCPRYHTDGPSRCPGCGGPDFSLKHPSCPVINCNKKHDNVEFCFECSLYPCERYREKSKIDSFISYRNVLDNLQDAKQDLKNYLSGLERKGKILAHLISNYNDGRSKGFYCLAVNLLPLSVLDEFMHTRDESLRSAKRDQKERAKEVSDWLKTKAKTAKIELTLRKNDLGS